MRPQLRPNPAIIIATAAAVVGLGPARAADAPPPDPAVTVVKATTECFTNVVRATGYVVPRATAEVMFDAPTFRIAEVSAKEGDWIKVGDQVAIAVASGAGPEAKPARVAIKSLASGLVLSRHVEVGMPTPPAGGALFTLAVDGEMEALVDVPSVRALDLAAGESAHVAMDDGREFSGHVRIAPAEIDRTTRFGQARLSIDSEQSLKPGAFLRVEIDAGRSCGIGVPFAALRHEGTPATVQVVADGIVVTRVVTLGLLGDNDAEIRTGLVGGDLVVSDAGLSLRDGDKVRPVGTDAQDPP